MLKKFLLVLIALVASIGMAIAAVNINTASEAELDSLPGVGPVKAKAIVDYRKANGNFKSLEDIKNVKGIGDKTFDDIKSQLSLSGATTPVAAKDDKKPVTKAKEAAPAAKEVAPAAAKEAAPAAKDVKPTKEEKAAAAKAEKDAKKAEKQAKKDAKKAEVDAAKK